MIRRTTALDWDFSNFHAQMNHPEELVKMCVLISLAQAGA